MGKISIRQVSSPLEGTLEVSLRICWPRYVERNECNSKKNAKACVYRKAGKTPAEATEEIGFPGTHGGPCGESVGSTFGKPFYPFQLLPF